MLKKFVLMMGMATVALTGTVLYAEENPAACEAVEVEQIAMVEEPNDGYCAGCNLAQAIAPACAAAMRGHYRQCCRWYKPCIPHYTPVRLISYQPYCRVSCTPCYDPCADCHYGYMSSYTGGHRGHHARKMARRAARWRW